MGVVAGRDGPETIGDRAYEWKVVLLLGLAFGLVGLDRWILTPLFPAMSRDLGLSYSDLGQLVGVLAISWGVFAVLVGRLSDRFGRRRVILPALLLFSLMSAFTGFAGGMVSLLLIRGVMGAAEGAYLPASVAATGEASHPKRRGFNQGLQMSSFALLGFGFAPIIATQLLTVVPSWREVFMIVALPGAIIAFLLFKVLREPPHLRQVADRPAEKVRWVDAIKSPNVIVATFALFGAMCCIFVMGAMVPNYLVDYLGLSPVMMGFVMSAMGWGGFVGQITLPGLSDHIGRRAATLIGFAGSLIFVFLFSRAPADPAVLFGYLLGVAFFGIGLLSLLTGPVPTEAVPAALTSSAIGFVSGAGEIFGGGVAPVIAGLVAERSGIQHIFWVPLIGLAVGLLVSLAMRETAPRRVTPSN